MLQSRKLTKLRDEKRSLKISSPLDSGAYRPGNNRRSYSLGHAERPIIIKANYKRSLVSDR